MTQKIPFYFNTRCKNVQNLFLEDSFAPEYVNFLK